MLEVAEVGGIAPPAVLLGDVEKAAHELKQRLARRGHGALGRPELLRGQAPERGSRASGEERVRVRAEGISRSRLGEDAVSELPRAPAKPLAEQSGVSRNLLYAHGRKAEYAQEGVFDPAAVARGADDRGLSAVCETPRRPSNCFASAAHGSKTAWYEATPFDMTI